MPSAAVTRLISGSNATAALIRFDGADRVNIDGRFGGIGNFFTFRNTSTAAPTFALLNEALFILGLLMSLMVVVTIIIQLLFVKSEIEVMLEEHQQ